MSYGDQYYHYAYSGVRHDVNGTVITDYQLAFSCAMVRNDGVYWLDSHGSTSFVRENRSADEKLVRALVKKGLVEVRTETYLKRKAGAYMIHDYNPKTGALTGTRPSEEWRAEREVFCLVPKMAQFVYDWIEADAKAKAARDAERHAKYRAENAERDADMRLRRAAEAAADALKAAHHVEYIELYELALDREVRLAKETTSV